MQIIPELHYSNEEGVEADEGMARKSAPVEKPTTDPGTFNI